MEQHGAALPLQLEHQETIKGGFYYKMGVKLDDGQTYYRVHQPALTQGDKEVNHNHIRGRVGANRQPGPLL